MTNIDFYVLQSSELRDQLFFACRLIEKAVRQGNCVLIATDTEEKSLTFDKLLWDYRPESFVPHRVLGNDSPDLAEPVVISHDQDDMKHHDVLVNLSLSRPPYFGRFKRMTEIVVQNTQVLAATRDNFKYYRERGYPLKTHQIS